MAKQKKTRRPRERTTARQQRGRAQSGTVGLRAALAAVPDDLLRSQTPAERPWKFLLPVLALAFAVRAVIALAGDFVLHPDEIMQYLEPAHRLVFGNGAHFWEFFYGARSWLVPGLVAGVLKLFDLIGLGEPVWYVGGVKLVFCALSLLIPAGMYGFARRHFSETAARLALLAGAFWYELAGFAHKPMTEFVATALLVSLLALCVRPAPDKLRVVFTAALLALLAAAIRLQYAPLALLLLGLFFFRTGKKLHLVLAVGAVFAAVGASDALTWDSGWFHSYLLNIHVNLDYAGTRAGESPAWQFLGWLVLASTGLVVLCVLAALRDLRRYALLLTLIALVVLIHSLQAHKEYRFIFVAVPLWLLIGADAAAQFASRVNKPVRGLAAALVAALSLAGILNALPYQDRVYQAWSRETGIVGFLRRQDPVFAAYRYLARAPGVTAVFHHAPYFNTPGYYYLHRKIPFYAGGTLAVLFADPEKPHVEALTAAVSHVVTDDPALSIPGYSVDKAFGSLRILRRDADAPAVRQWVAYAPTFATGVFGDVVRRLYPDAPPAPPHAGIRFADEAPGAGLAPGNDPLGR